MLIARVLGSALPVLVACRPAGSTTPPDPSGPDPTPLHTDRDPAADAEPPPCGATDLAFEDHTWAPVDAPAVASIQLTDPTLAAALTALGEHTRTPGHGLPIPLALSVSQWSWQVPLLVSTLRSAGFHPAELTFVAGDDAAHAWVWRSTCDLEDAIERVETAWSIRTRRTVDAVVGTPGFTDDGQTPTFPYDVLMLSGDRIALVPAGRGSSVLARLGRAAPRGGLGRGLLQTAGRRLDAVPPAPIRLVQIGLALMDPASPTTPGDARALRATAHGVAEVAPAADDASVGDPP